MGTGDKPAERGVAFTCAGPNWGTSVQGPKVGRTLRLEYAEAAANVLASEAHENKIYEPSSDPQTQETLAEYVGKAIEE
jgi:hypothetical protein